MCYNPDKYKVRIIYLASPFFTPSQIDREERIATKLRSLGYVVIRPKELGILPKDSSKKEREAVMKMDIDAIDRADAVFCITNDKDLGSLVEAGVAIAKNIPLIYYAEGLNGPFNVMLATTGTSFTTEDQLTRDSIDKAINRDTVNNYEGEVE